MAGAAVVVAVSVGAAAAFATSSTCKHISAGQVPDGRASGVRGLRRFIVATLRHPLWLAGIAADALGLTLQVTALHLGALAVVQPVLITGLLFALLLRQRTQQVVRLSELGWALMVAGSLVGFLVLSGTASQVDTPQPVDRWPAALVAAAGVVLAAVCVALGRRSGPAARAAALIGVAVGAVYAATAALLKALTTLATHGPAAVVLSWQLPVLLVLGAGGLLLNQLAFQAGPLSASLPAISSVDPLASVVIGIAVYDEPFRHSAAAGSAAVALLIVLAVSVINLARLGATETPTSSPTAAPRRRRDRRAQPHGQPTR